MATGNTWRALVLIPLAVSLASAYSAGVAAKPKEDYAKAAKQAEKEAKEQAKAAQKAGKPVRIKAPPKPGVKTVVAPGTYEVHRHRGNSPKFRPDREKDWVDPSGGKKPVRVKGAD